MPEYIERNGVTWAYDALRGECDRCYHERPDLYVCLDDSEGEWRYCHRCLTRKPRSNPYTAMPVARLPHINTLNPYS